MRNTSNMRKVAAAVLVAAILMVLVLIFVTRPPQSESPQRAAVESQVTDGEQQEVVSAAPAAVPDKETSTASAAHPSSVVDEPAADMAAEPGKNALRVILEGITEEDAPLTTVTVTGVDERAYDPRLATEQQRREYVRWVQAALNDVLGPRLAVDGALGPATRRSIDIFKRQEGLPTDGRVDAKTEGRLLRFVDPLYAAPQWPADVRSSWQWQGTTNEKLTGEFDLDPFFASVAQRNLQLDELEVYVEHPRYTPVWSRVPLSAGVDLENDRTVYEARVRLAAGRHVFWPSLTLAVLDAGTRAHLEDVELHCIPTSFMGLPLQPGPSVPYISLGGGLSSPIALAGARETDAPKPWVSGMALAAAEGETPQLVELPAWGRVPPERGILVFARAPGYAWGRIVLDVSKMTENELLLHGPAAALGVQMTNVQLERYAAFETVASLAVNRRNPGGGMSIVWFERLDERLEAEGLRLGGMDPGDYTVSVEMGAPWSGKKRKVLVREDFSLAAGETRELVLAVADPPAPPERVTLGGVVSFPAFDHEKLVRLQLFEVAGYKHGGADVDLGLTDMEYVGGALRSWSFRVEDLPVGLYQAQLMPFLTNWMIEVPAGGRDDVELVIPELAEVLVETVDARTGERVPLEVLRYYHLERVEGQVFDDWARAYVVEPGLFRFWIPPGSAKVGTLHIPDGLDYGMRQYHNFELVAGRRSIRFELERVCTIRFEFRVGGEVLPSLEFVAVTQGIRAVGHDGDVIQNRVATEQIVEVSDPGVYEISFEGVGGDRFHPIPPQRVEVRAGEAAEVVVELRRK